MYVIDSKQVKLGEYRAEINIIPDEYPISPNEMGDCEPEFFRAERCSDLAREIEKEGLTRAEVAHLYAGDTVKTKNGDWFYGVSEYRHSGSAFAFVSESYAWPDQQWDVIRLVGWIKISRELRKCWGIHGKKNVDEAARANAKGCLEEWQAYMSGEYCGYELKVYLKDEVLEEDQCWGFSSSGYAMEAAEYNIPHYLRKYGCNPICEKV